MKLRLPSDRKKFTPSQRLRAVMFIAWNKSVTAARIPFQVYYENKMSEIIEHIKKQL